MPRPRPSPASILAQVSAIRHAREDAPRRAQIETLARLLDGLNAWDAAERALFSRGNVRASRSSLLCGGPKTVEVRDVMGLGVVVWHRPPGYLSFKVLTLAGVWAMVNPLDSDAVTLFVGVKRLPFSAPSFDPEPYHKFMCKDYALYYHDDGALPITENRRATVSYRADERLAQREWLAHELIAAAQT